jgi:hypothetical protein
VFHFSDCVVAGAVVARDDSKSAIRDGNFLERRDASFRCEDALITRDDRCVPRFTRVHHDRAVFSDAWLCFRRVSNMLVRTARTTVHAFPLSTHTFLDVSQPKTTRFSKKKRNNPEI